MKLRNLLSALLVLACTSSGFAQAPGEPPTSPPQQSQGQPADHPSQGQPAGTPGDPSQGQPAATPGNPSQGQGASPAPDASPKVPSPIDIQTSLDRKTAALGETVVLTVDVSYPPSLDVQLPTADSLQFPPFEKRDAVMTPMPMSNGRKVARYTVRLAAYDTGKQTIPPFEISYKDADKNIQQAKSSPLAIEVQPTKSAQAPEGGQTADIRDIKPMQEVPTPAWMYAAAGAAALVVLLIAALGIRALVRRMRYRKPVPTTPHGIALAALDHLVADNLPAQGQLKMHYDRLAEILRSYLAQRFGLPVLEHTTAEVVTMMRDRNFEEALRTEVRLVLDEADLVKFAKLQVPVEKAFVQVHVVRGVVERTIPAPPQEGDGKPSAERTQQPTELTAAASAPAARPPGKEG